MTLLLMFDIENCTLGLPFSAVHELVRAVAITPLPGAPGSITGVINLRGEIVPVHNLRRRFGLRERETELTDVFVICENAGRKVALHVDSASDFVEVALEHMQRAGELPHGMRYLTSMVKTANGIVLVPDISDFLSKTEEILLADLLGAMTSAEE